jgi:hypothetical protein
MTDMADYFYLARRRTTGEIRFKGAWITYRHEVPQVGKRLSYSTAQDVGLEPDYNDDDEEDSGWDVVKVFDGNILPVLQHLVALDFGVYDHVQVIVEEVDKAKSVASVVAD